MIFLFFSDLHIKKNELTECSLVLNEILELCNKHNVEAVYDLGDTFDKINPESECLDLFAGFIKKLNRPLLILAANSHESTTTEKSIVNHFGILHPKTMIQKEYNDENHLYLGHFIVNESTKNYGGSVSKSDLAKYKHVILGHGHSHEIIKPNICQLGSCRYIDFGESKDEAKYVGLCSDYKTQYEKWTFVKLNSCYKMQDVIIEQKDVAVSSGKESQAGDKLDALNSVSENTKIRVIFKDFDSYYSRIDELEQFKYKFALFQIKKDFLVLDNALIKAKTETVSLKDSLTIYLDKNKVNEDIKQILLEEMR